MEKFCLSKVKKWSNSDFQILCLSILFIFVITACSKYLFSYFQLETIEGDTIMIQRDDG